MLLRLKNSVAAMTAMLHEQDRTANNLANTNTVGYKRDRTFTEALNQRLDEEGAPQSDRLTQQAPDLAQGTFESTGNPLDVAIDGDGFFVLQDEDSGVTRYTRAGEFTLDAEGMLRTAQGFLVEGTSGPIQLPPNADDITIAQDGTVRAGNQPVGRLRLVRFDDPTKLRRLDAAAFDALTQEPEDVEDPHLLQGHLETSNVDPIGEMTDMITTYRLFESQQKLLQSQDQILGRVTRELGRF